MRKAHFIACTGSGIANGKEIIIGIVFDEVDIFAPRFYISPIIGSGRLEIHKLLGIFSLGTELEFVAFFAVVDELEFAL